MPRVESTPRRLPLSWRRAFVRRDGRLTGVPGGLGVRLHLAVSVEDVWSAIEEAVGTDGEPIPFWAFAWAGGLALSRWLQEHPAEVAGRTVLDVGTGSGLVAIVAAQAGAERVSAVDIDPFAEAEVGLNARGNRARRAAPECSRALAIDPFARAAVGLNARANRVRLAYSTRDLLDAPPPAVDVLLAADTWYEGPVAERFMPWLRASAAA